MNLTSEVGETLVINWNNVRYIMKNADGTAHVEFVESGTAIRLVEPFDEVAAEFRRQTGQVSDAERLAEWRRQTGQAPDLAPAPA